MKYLDKLLLAQGISLNPESEPACEPDSPPINKEPVAPPGPDTPYWIPNDERWRKLPQQIRDVVPALLAPAYRRFVLDASGELERSIGLTLVHLTWLEICDHIKLAVATADPDSIDAILKNPDELLERHFRLATIKCQTAELLLKLQAVQHAMQRSAPTLPAQPPLSMLPSPLPPKENDRFPDLRALFPLPDESEEDPKTGNPNPR